ncbi:MAG TPA: hypothetical protein VKA40_07835 [Nitrososphaera sp.]|nr:hypothetical protein [Nitrososphaera sp.]
MRRRGTDIKATTEAPTKIMNIRQYSIAEEVCDSSFAAALILTFVNFFYDYQNRERYILLLLVGLVRQLPITSSI